MDFVCYVDFQDQSSNGVVNGTAAVRQDSFVNTTPNQDLFDDLPNFANIGCSCLSFETANLECKYFAKHCNYKRETVDSIVNTSSQ